VLLRKIPTRSRRDPTRSCPRDLAVARALSPVSPLAPIAAALLSPPTFILTFILTFALSVCFAQPAAAQERKQSYSGEGAQACLECHESDKVMGIRDTPHADFDDPRTPAARKQCESCHGPSATHMNFPMQVGNIVFTKHGKTPISDRNKTCLACHHEGEQAHWNEGEHGENLSCADCHVMHVAKDPALSTANQPTQCSTCHEQILSTAPAESVHPLTGENAIYCTQCHNPHGQTDLKSCTECHAQDSKTLARQSPKAQDYHKRGVSEKIDCTSCHKGFVHAMPQITMTDRTAGRTSGPSAGVHTAPAHSEATRP
jgi:predicted CXXCH cytochrome family protein